ncbi:FAD:protein FMN transferase [Shewanella sp. OMA3-2]|uniref:FAD:protein FMN transferase n=1 Tax=Shewanella sp. OMA3-2 TaxID=2908650 RepID=UPI001F478386|nr:FAD:protein FMN transferase [Shewanella sp. OMA3-2]UJF21170.1 FAD:protein FMN transferase [Shewanella sp. OMA3-2]
MGKFRLLVALILLFPPLVQAQWHQKSFHVMGTQAHVEFWLAGSQTQVTADKLISQVEQEMHRIDEAMSPYKNTSELSLVNRHAGIEAVIISKELFELLQDADKIAKLTKGTFDITYASVGYQYDYRQHKKPSQAFIDKNISAINYHSVQLDTDNSSVYFNHPAVKIDLGGIAKGHAVKNCLTILKQAGIKHALVSAGGDTGLLGDRRGRPWYVGIKHPRADDKTAVQLPLSNEAISTSGDYERYFIEDGVRYHHIINPKTGDSARYVVSVSIIGKNPTYVDALSTAIFVKGLQQGMALINQLPEYEAIIIDNQQTLHFSEGLQQD